MRKLETHMDSYEITKEQLDFYKKNGYLALKEVWPKEDIDILRNDVDDLAESYGKFTSRLDLHYHKNVKKIHRGKKMCDIADAILEEGKAVPVGSITFYCRPNNPFEFGSIWHQDNFGPMTPHGNYLNLATSIDDADKTNGALLIVPGSHKLGMLQFNPKPNFSYDEEGRLCQSAPIGDTYDINDYKLPSDLSVTQLEYKSGDVLCVHSFLLHKADKNKHFSRWRRTTYFNYIKENEPFWPGWTAKRELLNRYDSPNYVEEN